MVHFLSGRSAATLRLFLALSMALLPHQLSAQAFQTGDVFAGVGGGKIRRFTPSGTLLATLNTGAGATEDSGMAFDTAGNLYATVFEANNIYKFNNNGVLVGPFGSGYNEHPESIVFDQMGNAYVGQADGLAQVLKFSPTGALLASYSPQGEDRGTDWVDLAADQCTLHYTSEGSSIKQFNVCTNTQLPDFATGLTRPCFAHRIRPNSEEMVACTSQVYRLNSLGGVIQTYHFKGTSLLFALNLDPDNKSFWTADLPTGLVFHVDIATGAVITQFNAEPVSPSLAGLAVFGEITAAITQSDVYKVNYFSNNVAGLSDGISPAVPLPPDATVRIDNPGLTYGTLCAMIYVFDADQQLTECCGCPETHNGLRTLSVRSDLTSNPLTGVVSRNGVIKIVSAAYNGACDPTSGFSPTSNLRAWVTHVGNPVGSAYPITESESSNSTLGATELSNLQSQCSFARILGSGQGVCTCGSGD